jgi:hypothetical protein
VLPAIGIEELTIFIKKIQESFVNFIFPQQKTKFLPFLFDHFFFICF